MGPLELPSEQGEAAHHEQYPRSGNAGEREEGTAQYEDQADEHAPGSNGVPEHEVGRYYPCGPRPHNRGIDSGGPARPFDRRVETREKILETAVRLFSTQGYGTTSLSQVAKEAKVSKALIFWHFENKESLFRTAVQRTLEPYFINVLDDLEGLSEVEQIGRLVDEYYDFVSKNIYSVKFFLGLLLREEKHPDDLVGHMNELQRVYRNLLVDILEGGIQAGRLRADVRPDLQAGLIMSALHGIVVQGFLGDGPPPGAELLRHLKASLVDTVRR
jgi:AcrR family transcriptional regulator